MAFGETRTLSLYSGDGTDDTAGAVLRVLEATEYAYNVAAVVELTDQGHYGRDDLSSLSAFVRGAPLVEIRRGNDALRELVHDGARLRVTSLASGGSFTLDIAGVGKVIDALARVFDPARRRAHREQMRHDAAIHRIEERRAEVDLAVHTFHAMYAVADGLSNYNQRLAEALGPERARELTVLLAEEFGRAIGHAPYVELAE